MLKIFNKTAPQGIDAKSASKAAGENATNRLQQLREIISCFPIGARIRYYPEFKENIILETIILGYGIDGEIYYSDTHLQWFKSKQGPVLQLTTNSTKKQYSDIESLQFIIPTTGNSSEKLDYSRKEVLGRNAGLANGNNITIMGSHQQQRIPILQTTVTHRTTIRKGYYANQHVALLEATLNSLEMVDQRSNNRLDIHLPVSIRLNSYDIACMLADFNGNSARILLDEQNAYTQGIIPDQEIILNISLPNRHQAIVLRGHVFRREEGVAVVSLDEIEKSGHFTTLDTIDTLELKTLLLQSSAIEST